MADKKQEFVTHITPRDKDFSQWYTDVVTMADLMDYTPVRGCMAMKPYGNRIWELIREGLDRRFQETGHENVSMPMLIPESLLLKEAEHVEGFAPEVAWVTQGGTEKLQERLAVRPTSETIFCTMFAKWVESWRDLPLKYNQWCSVMRWEKTTRPFLRTAEFWWQEGHTVHATAEESQEETMTMLNVYRDFAEQELAMPPSDEAVEASIGDWLSQLSLPIDFKVSYEYTDGVLMADMDLPEIEHLPTVKARQLASGQVKEAAKSQKELKAEYAHCVFGLGMFCASHFYCVTPHMEKILLSAYTQRRNSKDIYSVIFEREGFEQPGYQQTDPEAFICRFKNRMNKLADGTLKKIEPFGPEVLEAQG